MELEQAGTSAAPSEKTEEPVTPEASGKVEPSAAPAPSGKTELSATPEPSETMEPATKPKAPAKQNRFLLRDAAREIAVHLAYELSFTDRTVEDLLAERLSAERFASLAEEDPVYGTAPDELQRTYITRLVSGVSGHSAELDGYIEKYAVGWKFARIPLVASAIMRVAMYEALYMPEIPNAAAFHSAVEIAKKYETPETVKFINGILGTFSRQELG